MDAVVAGVVLALAALSLVILRQLDPSGPTWGTRLRSRLLFGVPWGTLIAVGIVLVVYLVVQSAWGNLRRPVVIPFQSWSYTYPTGWLTAAFAHSGYGHLFANVTGALVLGSLAEYAYGHFPQRRGSVSFGSWRTNPYVRAFVIVPAAILLTGLFTSLFSIGPVIGFSGVVFAFAGFALIRYPLGTVIGLFAISALRRVYDAVRTPELTRGFIETGPSPPWWAEVAIQGHAIGFILGALIGIHLFRRRGQLPAAWRIWAGVFLFGIAQNLWAVYWFEGTDRWILLQGVGIVLVILLALLVTTSASLSDRAIVRAVSGRQMAVVLLAIGLAVLVGPAVPVNLITTDTGDAAERPGIEVDDYRVIYAEGIVNRMVVVGDIDIGGLGEVRTSGIIVYSESRDIWVRTVSSSRLASDGRATIRLGDVASRVTVSAERPTWSVVGNRSVYQVWLASDDERELAFESGASTADALIANHTVTLSSVDGTFTMTIARDGEPIGSAPIPEDGSSTTVGELTIEHHEGSLYAVSDGTVVSVATVDT